MKITSVALPIDLTGKIDELARQSERSRSFVIRKLLEHSLTAEERMAALKAIAEYGLEDYANTAHERAPNPAAIVAAASTEGKAMLTAHEKIASGNRKGSG